MGKYIILFKIFKINIFSIDSGRSQDERASQSLGFQNDDYSCTYSP